MEEDYEFRHFDGRCRLFPLPGVALFPHSVLPLHIFEPRYRQMTQDALASDKLVAIIQVRPDADWANRTEPQLESVACLGRILQHERLPDGRFNFLLLGRKRIKIIRELEVTTLYRQAEVELLMDHAPQSSEDLRRAELVNQYLDIAKKVDGLDPDLEAFLRNAPPLGVVTDLLAQALGLPASVKQELLAEVHVDRRADQIFEVLQMITRHLADLGLRPFPPPFSVN